MAEITKMLAKAHRHGGGCGRRGRCCVSSSYTSKAWGSEPKLRRAQRAFEKIELRKLINEEK